MAARTATKSTVRVEKKGQNGKAKKPAQTLTPGTTVIENLNVTVEAGATLNVFFGGRYYLDHNLTLRKQGDDEE